MINQVNHRNDQPELNREMRELISETRIVWNKSKDEIWDEMQVKMVDKGSHTRTVRTLQLRIVRYAAAAVLALFFGISAAMYFYTKKIETPVAQQTEISLPDHSKVRLYEQSVLSYKPLLWKISRKVRFEGEGFFEVQKGSKFEVISGKGKTVVLGTRFYINSRDDNYSVTCESGKVKVIEATRKNEAIITGGQKAILKPDDKFEIVEISDLPSKDPVQFQNQNLEEELHHILSTPSEPSGIHNRKENRINSDQRTVDEANIKEKTPAEVDEKAEIKEQIQAQQQVQEGSQKKEQAKERVRTETGSENQEKARGEQGKQETQNMNNKEKLRASLTSEQISILENQQMSREEKRKAFMESLSSEQRQWIQEQNAEQASQAEGMQNRMQDRENLKEQQKTQMHEQTRESSGDQDNEMLRQQTLENKDNINQGGRNNQQGSGNGSGN